METVPSQYSVWMSGELCIGLYAPLVSAHTGPALVDMLKVRGFKNEKRMCVYTLRKGLFFFLNVFLLSVSYLLSLSFSL